MKTTKFEDVLNTSTEKIWRGARQKSEAGRVELDTEADRAWSWTGQEKIDVAGQLVLMSSQFPYARSALPPKPARLASQPGLFLRCSAAASASCVSLTRGMCLVARATPASLVRRFIFTCVWLPSVNLITFSPLPLSCTVFTARHLASFVDLHTLCQTKKVCQCHDRMSVACCFNTWPHDSVAL